MFKTKMDVGGRGTLSCPLTSIVGIDAPVQAADIYMVLRFRPDFTWWHVVRVFRFVTLMDNKGKLHWFPEPVSQ